MVIGDLTGCSCISRWQNPPLTKPSYKKSFVQSCDQIVLGVVHHGLQPQREGVEEATLPTLSVNPPTEIRSRSALRPPPPPLPQPPPTLCHHGCGSTPVVPERQPYLCSGFPGLTQHPLEIRPRGRASERRCSRGGGDRNAGRAAGPLCCSGLVWLASWLEILMKKKKSNIHQTALALWKMCTQDKLYIVSCIM